VNMEMSGYGGGDGRGAYLTTKVIGDPSSAESALARSGNEIPVIAVVKPRSLLSCTLSIPTGVQILWNQSGAHSTAVPTSGSMKLTSFNNRISHCVTRNNVVYDCAPIECPTSDNVMVTVNCTVSFMIQSAYHFVYQLGSSRADQLLRGGAEEGVRKMVRESPVMQVKLLRGSQGRVLEGLKSKFKDCGVRFDDVKITEVVLPQNMQKALEATTEMMATLATIGKQHDVTMNKTEKELAIQLSSLQRRNQQDEADKNGQKAQAGILAETQKTNMREEAANNVAQAKVQVEVMKKNALSGMERAKNLAETNRTQGLNETKDAAQKIKLKADEDLRRGVMDSVEELAKAERDAKAIRLDAEVETNLKEQVALQRKHELALAQRKVLATLAEKGHYNLVGETGDIMLKSMMEGDFNESDFAAFKK